MRAGGESAHVDAGLGDGVLGGAAAPAGHRPGLGQLFLIRGQQPLDHLGELVDLGVEVVDAGQHGGQQRGVAGVKNSAPSSAASSSVILRRARARASWASTFGSRSPAMRWSMMSRPVTPCRSVTTADSLIAADSSSFPPAAFPGSARRSGRGGSGCAAGSGGTLRWPRSRRWRRRRARSRPPATASRPGHAAAGRAGAGPAWHRPARTRTLGLQPVERAFPVVAARLHHHRGHLPAAQPVRQRQHLPPGGAEAAGLGRPPRRVLLRRHPDRRGQACLPMSMPHTRSRYSGSSVTSSTCPSPCLPAAASVRGGTSPGSRGRAEETDPRARSNNQRPLG